MERAPIDLDLAISQHRCYEQCLESLGCAVVRLPPEPDLPDSVFVEDCAVVLDELAIIARPGAPSRRPETARVADALAEFRELAWIDAPGTLDGGDVLIVGREIYVGRSERTSDGGLRQLVALTEPLGYEVIPVPVEGCLHLKSGVGRIGPRSLLINRDWIPATPFRGVDLVDIDPSEPRAAGALLIGETVIYPVRFPRTRARLERAGVRVRPVGVSELAKAEGGVTCMSLVFADAPSGGGEPEAPHHRG
jgi:dimethylargininase